MTEMHDEQEDIFEDRFPQFGDLPLEDGQPWQLNACIGQLPCGNMGAYIEGYRVAAKALLAHVEDTGRYQDFLVYPLAFLWRHCLELQLKELVWLHRQLNDSEQATKLDHDLQELWKQGRTIAIELEPDTERYCVVVDGIVAQLDTIDHRSTGFRYPWEKSGQPTLEGLPERVNLGRLNEVMERTIFFLGCGASELSRQLDSKREWEAEMRSYYE